MQSLISLRVEQRLHVSVNQNYYFNGPHKENVYSVYQNENSSIFSYSSLNTARGMNLLLKYNLSI